MGKNDSDFSQSPQTQAKRANRISSHHHVWACFLLLIISIGLKHISCDLMTGNNTTRHLPVRWRQFHIECKTILNLLTVFSSLFFHSIQFVCVSMRAPIITNWMWLNFKWKCLGKCFTSFIAFPRFPFEFVQLIMSCQLDNRIWMNTLISLRAHFKQNDCGICIAAPNNTCRQGTNTHHNR